jgi:AraC-like DNA-binding protein
MQALEGNYLTLQLLRLENVGEWPVQGQGFTFLLAKGGCGQYVSASVAQRFLPGDLLILKSAEGGKITTAGDGLVFWRFSVCMEHLFPLFAIGEIGLLHNIIDSLKGPRLYPASSSLAQECHRLVTSAPSDGSFVHRSQMLGVAAEALSAEFKNARNNRDGFVRMDDHIAQVLEELPTSELLALSVDEIARKFNCGRRHLNRLFHQHFGCSVAALKMELRLLKALSLLRNPGAKIISVAEQCGFNHLGLFNACFKKRFGDTPGHWRNDALIGPANARNPAPQLDTRELNCAMRTKGLCPWDPKPVSRVATGRKTYAARVSCPPNGRVNPGLRETRL